ncbi:MAG: hypothetical protein SGPRY_008785, partial [Prymnesium sp.]
HLLTNRAGLRIAVLVNDVAAVNVDAATMRRSSISQEGVEMVELENGCVCCGPGSGALAPVVADLISRVEGEAEGEGAGAGKRSFDHVVVEMSGVADPTNVEQNLRLGGVGVAHRVAVVDANSFPWLYNSVEQLAILLALEQVSERPDLAGADAAVSDPCAVDRRVVELLLLQIESADAILVNKCDIASKAEELTTLTACRALNANAKIVSTSFGAAALDVLLPSSPLSPQAEDEGEVESEQPEGQTAHECCDDPGCTDPSHSHSHSHDSQPCEDPGCTDSSHSHSHSHSHPSAPPSSPSSSVPNSVESLGFTSFVYRARRPFIQRRLLSLVQRWPLPLKQVLSIDSIAQPGAAAIESELTNPSRTMDPTFASVLRSKGTAWLDSSHRLMASWSHAGRHFLLTPSGPWWASLPEPVMRSCFSDSPADGESAEATPSYLAERANFEGSMGDRRQEIVFIGTNLQEAKITAAMDACLASDEEMEEYNLVWGVEDERIAAQAGPLRFEKGTVVECCLGPDEWERGVVVARYYREAAWPTDRWTPYRVELHDGSLVHAPADVDECIRVVH